MLIPASPLQGRIYTVALILLIFLVMWMNATGMINLEALSLYSADSVRSNCVIWPKETPRQWVFMGSIQRGLWGLRARRWKSPPVSPPPLSFVSARRKTLQMYLGRLHLEVCSLRRTDEALPQAHGSEAIQVCRLWPQLFPLRSLGAPPPQAHAGLRNATCSSRA